MTIKGNKTSNANNPPCSCTEQQRGVWTSGTSWIHHWQEWIKVHDCIWSKVHKSQLIIGWRQAGWLQLLCHHIITDYCNLNCSRQLQQSAELSSSLAKAGTLKTIQTHICCYKIVFVLVQVLSLIITVLGLCLDTGSYLDNIKS